MLQASSQLKASHGSGIVNYLNTFLGLSFEKGGVKKKQSYAKLLEKYQNELIDLAYNDQDWKIYYDILVVYFSKDNSIRIGVYGEDDLPEEIKLLEFGTGDQPARPLIRNAEARFNADFAWRKSFKL